MKLKWFTIVPIVLIIASIISSIIAFNQNGRLNQGYLYLDNLDKTTIYEGEYFAIIGNIDEKAHFIEGHSLENYYLVALYDVNEILLAEYKVEISLKDQTYNSTIFTFSLSENKIVIDEMNDYLFKVNLQKDSTYHLGLSELSNPGNLHDIDIALVHISSDVLSLKSIMESVAYTTLIFSIVSALTILGIYYIKKR
ncbi:MAG TPA: hypothetical protein PK160_01980 [Bacillota bacterium]|nr:hypothetical protein [Bacillota bacterium]